MEEISFREKVFNLIFKIAAIATALSSIWSAFGILTNPEFSFREFLVSPPAICLYLFLLLTVIFVLLDEKYKSLQRENDMLRKKIEKLKLDLTQASASIESVMRDGQIATLKNRFFLATLKLYADLGEKIQNNIIITQMDVYNTIEPTGVGAKRDSSVKLSIKGIADSDNVSQIQILVAGDTITKWSEINLQAHEIINGRKNKLFARIADNGQDSYLKQVVISYATKKKRGDFINIIVTWQWPNMLNIEEEDYTSLPIALAKETKSISMTIHPKIPLEYSETSVYKYCLGQETAQHIMDVKPKKDNTITYSEDNPIFKSCYILYYKIRQ